MPRDIDEELLRETKSTSDRALLLHRYRLLLVETQRVRMRLGELARLEDHLLLTLRGSGVAYRRLASEMATVLKLRKSGRELQRLVQRLRQQRRRASRGRREAEASAAESQCEASLTNHPPP
jgi:hypothetical protein